MKFRIAVVESTAERPEGRVVTLLLETQEGGTVELRIFRTDARLSEILDVSEETPEGREIQVIRRKDDENVVTNVRFTDGTSVYDFMFGSAMRRESSNLQDFEVVKEMIDGVERVG